MLIYSREGDNTAEQIRKSRNNIKRSWTKPGFRESSTARSLWNLRVPL
jgi:hypothetical protein